MSDLEIIVREAREIDAEIRELAAKKDSLISRIKDELKVGDRLVVDGVKCSVIVKRNFSLKAALDLLDEDMKIKCVVTKTEIDPKVVRETVEALGLIDLAMSAEGSIPYVKLF